MRKLIAILKAWLFEKSIGVLLFGGLVVAPLLIIAAYLALISYRENIYEFRDDDPLRSAATVQSDRFGDHFTQVQYLDQHWKPEQSQWFYTTSQGSDLLPYDFFLEVEQIGATALFRDNDNINNFRYLPQNPSKRNPDGLPVGFVKDNFHGDDYLGFTCAACHTGQINYKNTGIRIDGGPASADLDGFVHALAAALQATEDTPAVRDRFVQRVLARGNYKDAEAVKVALHATNLTLRTYNVVNHSDTQYGYARLDAFGRIYNRVLEHVLTRQQTRELLAGILSTAQIDGVLGAAEEADKYQAPTRLERTQLSDLMTAAELQTFASRFTNSPNAPVSYPFLWDIPQHDYVQWNGIAANAGLGSVGRNTGEVIGVFGTIDWRRKDGFSISSLITGQGLETHVSFESSVRVHNLRRIESQLWQLQSPQWPENILPPIDRARAGRGEKLFAEHCLGCHSEINRDDPDRRVVAQMTSLKIAGTDPAMAKNSVRYGGWSGILRNEYVDLDAGSMLLDQKAPSAALLTKATLGTVATPYPYDNPIKRGVHWAYDLIYTFFTNDIKPSLKGGEYDPDTTAKPLQSLFAYKARPLNGIWATAPYLHNGSIPSLDALLLPKKKPGDPDDGEYRPETFVVGSREFDPEHVGLRSSGYDGFVFETTLPGNSNDGHEYTNRDRDGKIQRQLDKEARLDLIEYLKTL